MKHFSDITPAAERIVDAAEGLIQTVGYNGFSYEDVSRLVGIRKPSIHHHFPSKVELGVVVTQRYTHRFTEKLAEIRRRESTAAGRLKAYCRLFADTYVTDRRLCICGMLGAEASGIPTELHAEVRRFFEHNLVWLVEVLKEGQRGGELAFNSSAESQAEFFLSALEGSMLLGRGRQSEHGPQHVAKTFLAAIRV
jgi:TetR/AcrR family transcriptional repressor of nem operon